MTEVQQEFVQVLLKKTASREVSWRTTGQVGKLAAFLQQSTVLIAKESTDRVTKIKLGILDSKGRDKGGWEQSAISTREFQLLKMLYEVAEESANRNVDDTLKDILQNELK